MLWDVFCRVIDNFGDIGVCWRLAVDLGQRGHAVRLWVDDPAALNWMAPQLRWQPDADLGVEVATGQTGVHVLRWDDATRLAEGHPAFAPGEVVIEALGCDPPDAFIARMHRSPPPSWINLEYLSAEDYVERSHGLASPIWSGAGTGLTKRFFYPGFTPATGGLLREPDLHVRRAAFTAVARQHWLAGHGVHPTPQARLISLFCYPSAPVGALLDQLHAQTRQNSAPIHVLLTAGHATRLAQDWQATHPDTPGLHLHPLPLLPQAEFDHLLWSCDLNLVRGEDSAVRALWAGRPHVWQIYEQDDGVHAEKLDAFMQRWMTAWPPALRDDVQAWWRGWNGLAPLPAALPDFWPGAPDTAMDRAPVCPWAQHSLASADTLCKQGDLVTQLIAFVTRSG